MRYNTHSESGPYTVSVHPFNIPASLGQANDSSPQLRRLDISPPVKLDELLHLAVGHTAVILTELFSDSLATKHGKSRVLASMRNMTQEEADTEAKIAADNLRFLLNNN